MGLRARLTLCLLAVALVPLVLSATVLWEPAQNALRTAVLNGLDSTASIQQARVRAAAQSYTDLARLVGSRTVLRRTLDSYNQSGDPAAQETMLQILVDAKASVAELREITVLDPSGRTAISTDPRRIGETREGDPAVMRGREAYRMLGLFQDVDGSLAVAAAGPMMLNDRVIGVVLITAGADRITDITDDYSGLGKTGETLLLQRSAIAASLALTPLRFDRSAAFTRSIPITGPEAATASGADIAPPSLTLPRKGGGDNLLRESEQDYRGATVVLAQRSLEELGWDLLVKMDEEEAFAPAERFRYFLLGVAPVVLLGIPLAAFWVARAIARPLLDLAEVASRIRAGDLTQRAPVRSGEEIGTLAQAFNAMTDSLVETGQNLENRSRELARSNKELEQFAYVASHDLQEPLRAVAGCLQLLDRRHGSQLDAAARELMQHAVAGADRMRTMIDGLLTYSRVRKAGGAPELTDLAAAVDQAVANLSVAVEEAGARVTVDRLPHVVGDAKQLSQLFQNLLGNALKFRSQDPPAIHIGAQRRDGEWVVSVRDNGIGIEPQHHDRIFQLFQRLHPANQYPGTGLGLAICQGIVERHGGRMWVESEPGKGSTFYFTLREGVAP